MNAIETLREATEGWPTPNRYTDRLADVEALLEAAKEVVADDEDDFWDLVDAVARVEAAR